MTTPKLASRMERIVPFYVMDLLARAKQLEAEGRSVIHMEVGEPDFITPEPVIEAGKNALYAGHTGYTAATGIPELRQAISDHYGRSFSIDVDPARIIVTPGASGALQLVMSVLIDPEQEVLMTDPGYPCNKNFVELVSGVPVGVPVNADSNYQLNSTHIGDNWSDKTRAVMVATPSNPTGTVVERDEMARIHKTVKERGGHLIVDEIYQGLVYGQDGYSSLELADDLFVINSFSKYFGMTGWRLGWVVAPHAYVESLDTLAQNLFLSCTSMSQYAALEAFSPRCLDVLEQRRDEFRKRRDFLLPALQDIGFRIPVTPQGAFYLYV
ncbi:MAG: aminotransferase class I/II-fold pyridoxal phosphate-dependent enzyme, partial [Desulfofustis sp.]|nr:aminotransferase class I/II-fold pyridoxal phosphate-dependent enzyme [Desulfofustis sp.]